MALETKRFVNGSLGTLQEVVVTCALLCSAEQRAADRGKKEKQLFGDQKDLVLVSEQSPSHVPEHGSQHTETEPHLPNQDLGKMTLILASARLFLAPSVSSMLHLCSRVKPKANSNL
jgi:hypothetical protein